MINFMDCKHIEKPKNMTTEEFEEIRQFLTDVTVILEETDDLDEATNKLIKIWKEPRGDKK